MFFKYFHPMSTDCACVFYFLFLKPIISFISPHAYIITIPMCVCKWPNPDVLLIIFFKHGHLH